MIVESLPEIIEVPLRNRRWNFKPRHQFADDLFVTEASDQKLKDDRSGRVQREHLPVVDIDDDCATC